MKRVFILLLLLAEILCGCSTTYSSTSSAKFSMGKTTYISNYRVMQTLNPHLVLAIDNRAVENKLIIAIQTASRSNPMYDEQIISGRFVMVDTFTYETTRDRYGRTTRKTVPLVVPEKDYKAQSSSITNPMSL